MQNEKRAEKILVLGIDGMDPAFTRVMVDEGKMNNVKTLLERGAARNDLVMLGGVPTITPPMWTTLATGATPSTHGITCFWNQHPEKLDTLVYALDSRICKAEPVWNVLAEAGKKTLVWHWPGASWPPTSDSANLNVVEGTQPAAIHAGCGIIDEDLMVTAAENYTDVRKIVAKANESGAGCVINDLEAASADDEMENMLSIKETTNILFSHEDGEAASELDAMIAKYESPLKEPGNWADDICEKDAKEFFITTSNGLKRYPALLLKDGKANYTKVKIYKTKKDITPMIELDTERTFMQPFVDEVNVGGEMKRASRLASILELDSEGHFVKVWFSSAMEIDLEPELWYPKSIYKDVIENVGFVPPVALHGGGSYSLLERRVLPSWNHYQKWQSKVLNYLIEKNEYEMVFSQLHNIDILGHICWRWAKHREEYHNDEVRYQTYLEEIYRQTDEYIGSFIPLLDKGWTIIVTSDHGLICSEEDEIPLIGEGFGLNTGVMMDLGYTVMEKDADGNNLKQVDWSKTRAIASRGNHIYLNLIGRQTEGIVKPEEQYELEAQIISDLYNYRIGGKRVIAMAMRNKDAAMLGLDGKESGDIIYFVEEGFNRVHGDSLATAKGKFHTSVSPIFIAAGQGIKTGYTERVIREVDVAPTIAALAGVRMPAQCEGAPVYQIIAD